MHYAYARHCFRVLSYAWNDGRTEANKKGTYIPAHVGQDIRMNACVLCLHYVALDPTPRKQENIKEKDLNLKRKTWHWLTGADGAFHEVLDATDWRSMRRPMYDRVVDVPRLIATERRGAVNAETALGTIVSGVEELLGVTADHIGLNLYRSGADSVTWHRDRIGRQRDWSVIALVSLGGPRTLSVRPWSGSGHRAKTRHMHLASGDLVVMAGACQRDWEHAVLKTATAAPRISIALRSRQFPQGPLFQHVGVPPLTD